MLIIGVGLLCYQAGFHFFGVVCVAVGAIRAGLSLLVDLLS